MMGKLRIAISVVLLLAFDAIPDTIVNVIEKPIEAINISIRKSPRLIIGDPITKL